MPTTYEPIATTTPSGVSTFTFSSVPSTYTDLVLILSIIGGGTGDLDVSFNGASGGTLYSMTTLSGNGTAVSTASFTSYPAIRTTLGFGLSTTIPSFFKVDIFSYAGSTNKTCLVTNSMDRNGTGETRSTVGLWRNTAAITSIVVSSPQAQNFAAGTTATLYGIKAA
jgi:hypothetical protein